MGRISTSVAPTQTFNILLHTSDGGAKRRRRLKICLIVATILAILGAIGGIIGVTVSVKTKSSVEKLTEDSSHSNETLVETTTSATAATTMTEDNKTLLLIGGKKDSDFVNDVEAVGIKDCPKIKQLPDIDHNLKSLSTLTEDGYLIICTEYHQVIACHSKLVQEEEIVMPEEMKYVTPPRNHDVSK